MWLLARNSVFSACALLVIFLGLIVLVSAIPSSLVNTRLGETVETLQKEGLYPSVGFSWRKIVLDNFTDGVMLNIAYSVDSSDPVRAAIRNVQHDGNENSADQILNLEKMIKDQGVHETVYERYWHGYLIFLRPLLAMTSYAGVRVMLTLLMYGVFSVFIFNIWKRLGMRMACAVLIGLFAVDFFWLGKSLQLSNVFITGMLGSMYLLTRKKITIPHICLVFFTIGACTQYIDVLSAPLVSLGLLLIVTIGLVKKIQLKTVILLCALWSLGYLLLWAGKWVIAEYTYVPGAMSVGYRKVQDRTMGSVDEEFSRKTVVLRNFYQLRGYDKRNKILLLILGLCYAAFVARYFSLKSIDRNKILVFGAIAIIPYLWYLIAAEHSYIHVLFTYRNQFITVAALFLLSTEFVDWKRFQKDVKRLRTTFS